MDNLHIWEVNVDTVADGLKHLKDFVLLDVRTEAEFNRGKIPGSLHLPVDEVEEKVEKLLADKQKQIYVYCLSGARSADAVSKMIQLGYKNVFSMKNGLLAWRAKGYQLV